jgi:hypothetical protein
MKGLPNRILKYLTSAPKGVILKLSMGQNCGAMRISLNLVAKYYLPNEKIVRPNYYPKSNSDSSEIPIGTAVGIFFIILFAFIIILGYSTFCKRASTT